MKISSNGFGGGFFFLREPPINGFHKRGGDMIQQKILWDRSVGEDPCIGVSNADDIFELGFEVAQKKLVVL